MSLTRTSIEWCRNDDGSPGHTVNPIRARFKSVTGGRTGHYCEKTSPGCTHCYSSALQRRFGTPEFGAGQYRDQVEIFLDESKLLDVLRYRKPTRLFAFDMTDLFGEWMPDEWIDKYFAVAALTPHITHMLLTKRAERMREHLLPTNRPHRVREAVLALHDAQAPKYTASNRLPVHPLRIADDLHNRMYSPRWPLPNVLLGNSVENNDYARERLPHLRELKQAGWRTFCSYEPALGPVDWEPWADAMDWLVMGGESGPGARRCDIDWLTRALVFCQRHGIAPFVKQLGARPRYTVTDLGAMNGAVAPIRLTHRKGADPSEWPEDLRVREFPTVIA